MGSSSDDVRSRVLVWGLSNNRAGTEMVIYNYAKSLPDIAFDFLCYDEPLNFPDLFPAGGKNRYFVIPIKIKRPFAYVRALRRFMREHGHEYSTLWFNVNDVSNIDLLKYAESYGIGRRITHMHNSSIPDKLVTRLFSKLNWAETKRLTTDKWACSQSAGQYLFGESGFRVVPNLVNAEASAFSEAARDSIRASYGIDKAFVVGMVGRLAEQKNPRFVLSLFPDIVALCPNAVLLFVGNGILESALKQQAKELGIEDRVVFAGSQKDVGAFLSAMDVLAVPSLYEGMSLTVLEAQFNGVPCVFSEGIERDSFISLNVVQKPLEDRAGWISSLTSMKRVPGSLIDEQASRFDLSNPSACPEALFVR